MKQLVKCTTSKEVYKAISNGDYPRIYGSFYINLRKSCQVHVSEGSPYIDAREPTLQEVNISTWGNSSPSIVVHRGDVMISTREYSHPRVALYGGRPALTMYDESRPLVDTGLNYLGAESVALTMMDQSYPILKGFASFEVIGPHPVVKALGSVIVKGDNHPTVQRLTLADPLKWVKFFDLPVVDDEFVYLYKALGVDFRGSYNGFLYQPGTIVEAPDWDPTIECGGGLHFSPTPRMANHFYYEAQKFVACKVKISEILVHPMGHSPEKVKAPRVYEIFEVDVMGNKS
jgi:hypothetical protein